MILGLKREYSGENTVLYVAELNLFWYTVMFSQTLPRMPDAWCISRA